MSSVEPNEHADEQDASQKRGGELVVARCDGAEFLQGAEEALDEVAFAIEGEVGITRLLGIGLRGDDGRDVARFECLDQGFGIVALVGDQRVGLDRLEQGLGLGDVGGLPRRQRERDWKPKRIDDRMDLGRQPAARAADGLILAVFF